MHTLYKKNDVDRPGPRDTGITFTVSRVGGLLVECAVGKRIVRWAVATSQASKDIPRRLPQIATTLLLASLLTPLSALAASTHTAHAADLAPTNTTTQANNPQAPAKTVAEAPVILVLGDSLSAEYGLPRGTGWVALLAKRLADNGNLHYTVSNGSISGDTTSGGRSRLPALLARVQPTIVIVELGANDALRGLPLATTRANLEAIIQMAQAHQARVLLVGMQIPPNYGQAYTTAFSTLYPTLAKRYHTALVPFLLDGIADKPALFQADQMHPLPQAQPELLNNVWKPLQPLIHAKPPQG